MTNRNNRKKRKKRLGYGIRRFDGKPYQLSSGHHTKGVAQREARRQKSIGLKVRVIKVGKKWNVYVSYA